MRDITTLFRQKRRPCEGLPQVEKSNQQKGRKTKTGNCKWKEDMAEGREKEHKEGDQERGKEEERKRKETHRREEAEQGERSLDTNSPWTDAKKLRLEIFRGQLIKQRCFKKKMPSFGFLKRKMGLDFFVIII